MADNVVIYGSSWCAYTQRALGQLDELGVTYRYIDIDESPADERRIADWNQGQAVRPTLDIGGDIFVNPSPASLESELRNRGLVSAS